jgi:hypothetical protein
MTKQPFINPIRQLGKHLTFFFLFMTVVGVTMAKAQDKYTFFSFEMYNEATDTYYLVVSDPVKNWYNDLSKEQRDDFVTDFRVTANKQAGVQIMKNYQTPIPIDGNAERYNSLSQCREGIQKKEEKHKSMYKDHGTVKVIYVNLHKY